MIASGFPGSVRVFTASLPGLSGLHITPKPLIYVEDNNSSPKTHHPQLCTRREVNKPNPANHTYSQLITSNYRSTTGLVKKIEEINARFKIIDEKFKSIDE